MKNRFKVLGLMSGTSMDGLDLAYCEFTRAGKQWDYTLKKAQVVAYSSSWLKRLNSAQDLSAQELLSLDVEYGKLLGSVCRTFIIGNKIKPDFIASHGHTVFHQPESGFTLQIGNINAIYGIAGIPVIGDFRSLDVVLGGQGAPLVPVGDKLLFSEFDVCLNLGGIANISFDEKKTRKAFDVCFCNMPLNYLVSAVGKKFDKNGELASEGQLHTGLLAGLSAFYRPLRKKRPSLGREMFEKSIKPLLDDPAVSLKDKLFTSVEATAIEISTAVLGHKKVNMLCTGGGAFNSYLVSRILHYCGDQVEIIVPEDEVIKFKEALVFAFLGVLRYSGVNNVLASVTGASRDNCGGMMTGFKLA